MKYKVETTPRFDKECDILPHLRGVGVCHAEIRGKNRN